MATMNDSTLLSIGDICSETGLSSDVVRVWERRYGFPKPVRLPSGHRRYGSQDLNRLRLISEAVALGHRPSIAVGASDDVLKSLVNRPIGGSVQSNLEIEALLTVVKQSNSDEIKKLLDAALVQKGLRSFTSQTIAPLLQQVGIEWAEGRLDIHHEKLLTEVLEDLLRRLRNVQKVLPNTDTILLATLPGEPHRLGLLMAALIYANKGHRTEVLGNDVPVANIAKAARQTGANKVAVSLSIQTSGENTRRLLLDLQERLPQGCTLVIGGQGVVRTRKIKGIERMTRLEDI